MYGGPPKRFYSTDEDSESYAMTETSIFDPVCDIELARRMERAEGIANAEFVDARAQAIPDSGACWVEIAGTYAMFDGVNSPCTQTFGLGIFESIDTEKLDTIESFFSERGSPVFHEVCPLVEPSTISLLNQRGYQPIEFSNVLYRSIVGELNLMPVGDSSISARAVASNENLLWSKVAAAGWKDVAPNLDEYLESLAPVMPFRINTKCCLAEIDGQPIAAGALNIGNKVALLAGACTIPEYRRRGAQRALLQHRLEFAADQGCELAVIVAQPGSASQRNAERQGFRVAYTRIKWQLRVDK